MIASLRGTLAQRTNEYVIVDVGGVGYKAFTSASTLETLGATGDTVTLVTHLHVREDNISLFGFATVQELKLFELLLGVSGVGPKVALGILSTTPVDSLYAAIAAGSAEMLTRIPGVGAKTAGRIVLELKNKIDPQGAAGARPFEVTPADIDVIAALTNLGYSVAEAQSAIHSLSADVKLTTEEKIVAALRYFAESRP